MPLGPLVYDLALLYLALAHGADAHLDEAELVELRNQLERWAPALDPARLDQILNEAMLGYLNGVDEERFSALLQRLEDGLDEDARKIVLNDLRTIARADDRVHPGEVAFITRVEEEWGV